MFIESLKGFLEDPDKTPVEIHKDPSSGKYNTVIQSFDDTQVVLVSDTFQQAVAKANNYQKEVLGFSYPEK